MSGSEVAKARQAALRQRIEKFHKTHGRKPGLAVVIAGEDPASQVYVRNKVRTATDLGLESFHIVLPQNVSETELISRVEKLNQDPNVDGILVQLPMPIHIATNNVLDRIRPEKDPDGLTVGNLGLLMAGRKRIAPCTPWGVMALLEHYKVNVAGSHAVVVGRSNIVGKPMAQLLLEANATVTVCHSRTKDLHAETRRADIVVVAAGVPRFLGRDAFKPGAVVIDVGIHKPASGDYAGKLCGDVRYEELDGVAQAATPVPGGVGPMTIQMLMENTVTLAEQRIEQLKSAQANGHHRTNGNGDGVAFKKHETQVSRDSYHG